MPQITIPLVGQPTQRGSSAATAWEANKDQLFKAVYFSVVDDPQLGNKTVYCEKRPGFALTSTPAAGKRGEFIFTSSFSTNINLVSAFRGGNGSEIYSGTTLVGTTGTGVISGFIDTIISDEAYLLFVTTFEGWYLRDTATTGAFSGTTTIGSPIVSSIASTAGFYEGQLVAGTGITVGTRILTVDSANQITMTANATANGTPTISREAICKILSFIPVQCRGRFACMDGYIFIAGADGYIYQSGLNSITSWSSDNKVAANVYPDLLLGVVFNRGRILAFGQQSIEQFFNAGNASGSVLSIIKEATIKIGARSSVEPNGSPPSPIVTYDGDTVFFLSAGSGNNLGIWSISGDETRKISNTIVDSLLKSSVTADLSSFGFNGETYLCFTTYTSTSPTLWYNVNNGMWSGTGFVGQYIMAGGTNGISIHAVSRLLTAGKIYSFSANGTTFTDDSAPYTMTIQSKSYALNNGMPFKIKRVGLLADNQASGTTALETSSDDYATWDAIDSFDMTANQKEIFFGYWYESAAAFRLTHSANTAWRGQALVVDWEPAAT